METETNFFIVDSITHKNYGKTIEKAIKEYATFREECNRILTEYIAFVERDMVDRIAPTPKIKTEDRELINLDWRKYGF